MSKPILPVTVMTLQGRRANLRGLFDTGSYFTIVRQAALPSGTTVPKFRRPEHFKTANKTGRLTAVGVVELTIIVNGKIIRDGALVSPDLGRDLLVGSKTMQAWDISIKNQNGHTKVVVGRDLRDPEITEVD